MPEPKVPDLTPLIKELDKIYPKQLTGMVVLHFDPETRTLKSITPAMPVQDMKELVQFLLEASDAIKGLANDIVNKLRDSTGQAN
jgi:hypothetical protein